jgi:hypothetical protein
MSISPPNELESTAISVSFSADRMVIVLADGRELSVPLAWFPRLQGASATERQRWELIGGGTGIHWPLLDEDISVENLLLPGTLKWSKAASSVARPQSR